MFTQKVFTRPSKTYGIVKKCVLSTFGPKQYSVAYFSDPTKLVTNDTADFKKRKDAIYSINCYLDL